MLRALKAPAFALLILALCSVQAAAADWETIKLDQPTDLFRLEISYPGKYFPAPEEAQGLSIVFTDFDEADQIQRTLRVQGQAVIRPEGDFVSVAAGSPETLAEVGKSVFDGFVEANEAARSEYLGHEVGSVGGLPALKISFDAEFPLDEATNLYTKQVNALVQYPKSFDGQELAVTVILRCAITAEDGDKVKKAYGSEFKDTCSKFFDSLVLLDK